MKVGDLVTVLPYGKGVYLVIGFVRPAIDPDEQDDLGPLWTLYGDGCNGVGEMHEKWMSLIIAA